MANLAVDPEEIVANKRPDKDRSDKIGDRKAARLGRPMSDLEFQGLVFDWATDARNYVEEFLAKERHNATEYYKGHLPDVDLDDAQEDRSRAVLTEVRDTVLGIMPDLLRIFFSADGVVEFQPVASDDPQIFAQNSIQAKQATAYIRDVVLKTDNPDFFLTSHDVFQDALVRKTGFYRWQWEKTKKPSYSMHTGLSEGQATALAADPEVEIVGKREYPDPNAPPPPPPMPGAPPAPPPAPPMLYDLKVKRILKSGKTVIRGVPCESIIVARRGTRVDRSSMFGFTEDKTVGDFIAEGWIEEVEELADCDQDPANDGDNWETQARRPHQSAAVGPADNPANDPSARLIKYGELYITADRDGDGIPELIRVITAGNQYKILDEEPVDEINFAAICPYPEAYQFFGESVADLTQDIQRIKSRILRDVLDSLAQSVQPQTAVVEGQVNLDDVLNPDTSKIIRMRQAGMVQPMTIPFVGKEALPVLDLMTQVRENRTGQSDASAGLDPSVLQSSTASAVHATLSKAQSRVEMVARIFAETGFARLFRGILRETVRHMDSGRCVILDGKPCMVDPRQWDVEMHVTVCPMLGRGSPEQQISYLTQILSKQEQLLQEMGFDNPICSLDQYCYTLRKLVELVGWRNTGSFFSDTAALDPQTKAQVLQKLQQQMAQKAQASQKSGPDPQIEQAKIASNEKIEQNKLQLEQMKEQAAIHLEVIKQQGQLAIARMQMLTDHAQAVDQQKVDAHVALTNSLLGAHVDHAKHRMENATKLAIAKMQPATPAGGE